MNEYFQSCCLCAIILFFLCFGIPYSSLDTSTRVIRTWGAAPFSCLSSFCSLDLVSLFMKLFGFYFSFNRFPGTRIMTQIGYGSITKSKINMSSPWWMMVNL